MGATRETFPGVLCDNLTPLLVARKIYYIARTICLQSMRNVANLAKYTHILYTLGRHAYTYIYIYIYTYACTCLYVYITKFLHIVNPHIEISLIACSVLGNNAYYCTRYLCMCICSFKKSNAYIRNHIHTKHNKHDLLDYSS